MYLTIVTLILIKLKTKWVLINTERTAQKIEAFQNYSHINLMITVRFIKDNGKMDKDTVEASNFGLMDLIISVCGKIIWQMERVV